MMLAALAGLAPLSPTTSLLVKPFPQLMASKYTARNGLPDGPLTLSAVDGRVIARGTSGTVAFTNGAWRPFAQPLARQQPPGVTVAVVPPGQKISSWARAHNGDIWMVTTHGAWKHSGGRWTPLELPSLYRPNQPVPNIDATIREVVADGAGTVWIATDHGVIATDGASWWHPLDHTDGMPFEDLLCVTPAPNGDLWGGTTQGAWRLRSGEWRYFYGPRWLPGNRVNSIAVDGAGDAWLATNEGVARIHEQPSAMSEKAAHYEQITAARHNRRGYVTSCVLNTPGDPDGGFTPEASDNDGLWTAMYLAAEAFRYGATRAPEARDLGRKSMQALLDLVRLSGVAGFPARAVIRKGEKVEGYDPDETVRIEDETEKIWYPSPVDPNVLCKGDTSSDELDGHYFGWYVYYELAADEEEKRQIREVTRAVTDNILLHGYTLVGHTGRKTRWGVWAPKYLNDDPRWWDERGLNSAELLCYLKVAAHVCGDKRFADAYEDLILNHHYLLNTLNYRRGTPWYGVNHSDDELAFLVYYPLLLLERDPHRHAILAQTVSTAWKGLKGEHASLYNFMYGAMTGEPCEVEASVQTLRDWPWELVSYPIKNGQRTDVTIRQSAVGRNRLEIDRVLPASERVTHRWNSDPYEPDGGNPRSEEDGTAWLLPYWMARYHGFIAE